MAKTSKKLESRETRALVKQAFHLARELEIGKVLVQADELQDVRLVERIRETESVIWLVRDGSEMVKDKPKGDAVIDLPETGLTRLSQLSIGLFRAVISEQISLDESVICLSGVAGTKRLDTLLIANPRRDFPWFRKEDIDVSSSIVASRELGRMINVALRFAAEGREGKPIGTIFVLGDAKEILPHTRQLILNPCHGHPNRQKSIHNDEFVESLRELAALDGAFVINRNGVVESAGVYLDASAKGSVIETGLGARHTAAAAITFKVDSVAVVISESSGAVTVFHQGRAILELERPDPVPKRKKTGRRS